MHFFELMLHFYKETKFTYCFKFFINLVGLYKPQVIAVGNNSYFFFYLVYKSEYVGWVVLKVPDNGCFIASGPLLLKPHSFSSPQA